MARSARYVEEAAIGLRPVSVKSRESAVERQYLFVSFFDHLTSTIHEFLSGFFQRTLAAIEANYWHSRDQFWTTAGDFFQEVKEKGKDGHRCTKAAGIEEVLKSHHFGKTGKIED